MATLTTAELAEVFNKLAAECERHRAVAAAIVTERHNATEDALQRYERAQGAADAFQAAKLAVRALIVRAIERANDAPPDDLRITGRLPEELYADLEAEREGR